MKLSVIIAQESDEKLEELIEKLKQPPGYGPGRDVIKIKNIPGKYILSDHRGRLTESHIVRIIDGKIIVGKALNLIEQMLRRNKITFKEYNEIKISGKEADAPHPAIYLPDRTPNLIYKP